MAIPAIPPIESLGEESFGVEVGNVLDVVVEDVIEDVAVVEVDESLVLVKEDEVEVPEVVELPAGKFELGLAVVLQTKTPWISPELASTAYPLQSIGVLLWILNPPFTFINAGITGLQNICQYMNQSKWCSKTHVEKFPDKLTAPPTFDSAGNEIDSKSELLNTCIAPPTLLSAGKKRLVILGLSDKARFPCPVAKDPTDARFGASKLEKELP